MIECPQPDDKLPEGALSGRSFPIMDHLLRHLERGSLVSGLRVGWHCHLTWLTALAARVLVSAGAKLFLSECNPDTTDPDALEFMRSIGAEVHTGPGSCQAVLSRQPHVLSDTGLVLISSHLSDRRFNPLGACEITTSGIARLRGMQALPLPVVNINDGQLKSSIENFHGVGDGLTAALSSLTGQSWSGRRAAVVGYGRVGAGVAHYLRKLGAFVTVVEREPVRHLVAHYDGFQTGTLESALSLSELLVTATGVPGLIGPEEWAIAAGGLYVFNVGHWPAEVSPEALDEMAISKRKVSEHLEEWLIPDGSGTKKVYLAASGSPVNVVLESGSAEPTLIHLTTEILSLAYLYGNSRRLPAGEIALPAEIERQASRLALAALGLTSAFP